MSTSSATPKELQSSGIISREQLLHLFSRFSFLISQPEAKKRIVDTFRDKKNKVGLDQVDIMKRDFGILLELVSGEDFFHIERIHANRIEQARAKSLEVKEEAVAITTAIQEEVLLEMGIDPRFGIAFLGKVHAEFENDMDLMIQFYRFVAKEEMAIDEAELEPDEFMNKMHHQHKLQEQQLEMLENMRRLHPDDQSTSLEMLHKQMESANFDNSAAFLTLDQIQEIARQRTAPFSRA